MKRFRRIVHASDFSPASRRAFEQAVDLAKANRAELVLVHVMETVVPWAEDAYVSAQAVERLLGSARTQATKQLDALARKAKAPGVRVTTQLVDGSPREAIPLVARRKRADLVVVGTHGRTGLGRLLLGSVAERIVATSPCPVLTVRGRA
jgi:nucleotide-binding universal stress UspA family protein